MFPLPRGVGRGRYRPQAQQVTDREDEISAIHRVEVKGRDAAVDKIEDLLGSDRGRNQFARGRIVVEPIEALGEPGRHRGAATFRKAGCGLEVLHRQNARHDRDIDAARTHTIEITEIKIVFEEELGDGAARAGIKRLADVEVSVAAYPEKHPESPTVEADLDMLVAKVDAGATRAITQFFFENDRYFDYLDRVRGRGINVPVVPGILPVQNFKQTKSFAARCGASVPEWLARRFDGLDEDAATRKLIAAAVAAEQVLDLVDRGVTDFHFYTMNRADLVYAVCHLLGLRPSADKDVRNNGATSSVRSLSPFGERVGVRGIP